jgi:uncharacterized protein YjiS (DUF1127 family)
VFTAIFWRGMATVAPASAHSGLEDNMSNYLNRQTLGSGLHATQNAVVDGVFQRIGRAITRHWNRRGMIRQMEALDDRILADIGILRADIPRVVDGLNTRELRMKPVARSVVARN